MVWAPAAVANVAIDRAMNNTGTADTTRPDDELEDMCFLGRAHGGAGFTTRMQPHHRSDAGPPAGGRVPCPRRSAVPDGDELILRTDEQAALRKGRCGQNGGAHVVGGQPLEG